MAGKGAHVDRAESPQGEKPNQSRAGTMPRYVQVANELRADIGSGRFCGGQLPTETMLCDHYNVSRFTVREALRRLQAEGLISRRRGSGTRVYAGNPASRLPISGIADPAFYAAEAHCDFDIIGTMTMGPVRAADLGLAAGSRWIQLAGKRRRDASGPATALTDVYIHVDFASHVAGLRPGNQSLFAQLARAAGFRIGRVDQDLRAMAAGSREAIALGIPRRAPVLRIVRSYRDTDGRVVEVSVSAHPGDRFTYSTQISAD